MPDGIFEPLIPRASSASAGLRKVYTVSELTSRVKAAIEENLGTVWVEGEVSDLSKSPAAHVYFSLRDESSSLKVVIWRGVAARLGIALKDGDQILVLGRLTVYEPRGQYQLIAERVELKGAGAMQRAFEELKARLAKEGLFDPSRKRRLPFLPRAVGIVTSLRGAAVHDLLNVLWERFPRMHVVIRPARVQGDGAPEDIAQAIRDLNEWGGCDVLIVGRGGGSSEDLSAFNEEVVVRAIASSRIPVVSAVGHEVDVTLADFAADCRALTPTDAAVKVVPRLDELISELDSLSRALLNAAKRRVSDEREYIRALERSYGMHAPEELLLRERQRLDEFATRLPAAFGGMLQRARTKLAELSGKLFALSPLAALGRGYTITTRAGIPGGVPLRNAAELRPGDRITTRFASGEADSTVEATRTTPPRRS